MKFQNLKDDISRQSNYEKLYTFEKYYRTWPTTLKNIEYNSAWGSGKLCSIIIAILKIILHELVLSNCFPIIADLISEAILANLVPHFSKFWGVDASNASIVWAQAINASQAYSTAVKSIPVSIICASVKFSSSGSLILVSSLLWLLLGFSGENSLWSPFWWLVDSTITICIWFSFWW